MAKKLMLKDGAGFDEWLRTAYCEEGKTMQQIANEVGCTAAAIHAHIHRCGIQARKNYDYPATEKAKEAWRKNGAARKGAKLTEEQKAAISAANKGRRKRADYEFGGHEKKRDDGYIAVYCPDHPNCNKEGYVLKHRLVMERAIGMFIPDGYVVHHINHVKDDNRIENLALVTFSGHAALHMAERHLRRKSS